jgi:hypothetical protein
VVAADGDNVLGLALGARGAGVHGVTGRGGPTSIQGYSVEYPIFFEIDMYINVLCKVL